MTVMPTGGPEPDGTSGTTAPPAPSRRRTIAAVAIAAGIAAALAIFVAGILVPPMSESCPSPPYSGEECHLTIDAAMRRGLGPVHPLILAARAEPGPDRQPEKLGHRDTAYFDMLGIPGAMAIELHFDVGAHWDGVPDRTAGELAIWSVAVAAAVGTVVGLLVAGVLVLVRRVRRHA